MKRLRTFVAAVTVALALAIAGAPTADATDHVVTCGTWSHANKSGQACVKLNVNSLGVQAKATFSFSGNLSNNFIYAEFDYLRLTRGGSTVKAIEGDSRFAVGQTFATSYEWFSSGCLTYKATARYRFLHSVGGPGYFPDGHGSGWIIRTTAPFEVCF
jgi:hypothetical protein